MRDRVVTAVLCVSAASTASVLVAFLWFGRYGLDYTDEGYYLNWMSDPGAYSASTTQFGFVYHPLYLVVGGHIPLLRAVNVLLVLGLAWLAADRILTNLVGWRPHRAWHVRVCSAGLATTGAGVFSLGLLTPSYNSLSMQALLVTLTGVVLAVTGADDDRSTWIGWVTIGAGGWLAFMAKPTTALSLAILVLVVVLGAGAGRIRGLVVAAASAAGLVLVSALAIDGSPGAFARRLQSGAEMLSALGGGHEFATALRWDPYEPSRLQVLVLLAVAGAVALAALAGALHRPWARRACGLGAAGAVGAILVATRGPAAVFLPSDPFSASLLLALPLAAAAMVLVLGGRPAVKRITRAQWAVAAFLGVLPFAFAFGSNGNYWRVAGQAGVFWVLIAAVLLAPLVDRRSFRWPILATVASAQVLAVLLVVPAMESPYRQPGPLWAFDTPVEAHGATVVLHPAAALHVRHTRAAVREAGLEEGQAVLDLTGRSPGMLHLWGAHSLVQPWSIGGYPGSEQHEALALARVPCDALARVWLLTEPAGPRHIAPDVLATFGAELDDFDVVASWDAPVEVTRDAVQRQQLRAPARDAAAAEAACLRSRGEQG